MEVRTKSIKRMVLESKFCEQVVRILVGILRVLIVIYTIKIQPCIKIRYLLILEIALNRLRTIAYGMLQLRRLMNTYIGCPLVVLLYFRPCNVFFVISPKIDIKSFPPMFQPYLADFFWPLKGDPVYIFLATL